MPDARPATEQIDAYIAGLDPPFADALAHVRTVIRAAAPEATEAMVYGVPGLSLNGKGLVCYAAFKAHCGFYPMSPELMDTMKDQLEGFRVAKGTIHFTPDHPLPKELITKLVAARIAEQTAKAANTPEKR